MCVGRPINSGPHLQAYLPQRPAFELRIDVEDKLLHFQLALSFSTKVLDKLRTLDYAYLEVLGTLLVNGNASQ